MKKKKQPTTTVETPNFGKLKIALHHEHRPKGERFSVVTTAKVMTNRGKILGTGQAKCFAGDGITPADNFNRHEGVKKSLARALGETPLMKEDREAVWSKVWSGKYQRQNVDVKPADVLKSIVMRMQEAFDDETINAENVTSYVDELLDECDDFI